MKKFGLVGKDLSHSFSKAYFEKKFRGLDLEYTYENFQIPEIGEVRNLLKDPVIHGLNVTIPYKESIIPYLGSLSPEAASIGAVNCISFRNGATSGHNTDVYGFSQSIKPFLDTNHGRALVLGTGGSAKAVAFALKRLGVEVFHVTRSAANKAAGIFTYAEVNELMMQACKLIVNATPAGTSPRSNECPEIPYQFFTPQHLAFDLVYNPAQTLFLQKAAEKGALTVNGLSMLQLQAEKSWEIWNS